MVGPHKTTVTQEDGNDRIAAGENRPPEAVKEE